VGTQTLPDICCIVWLDHWGTVGWGIWSWEVCCESI